MNSWIPNRIRLWYICLHFYCKNQWYGGKYTPYHGGFLRGWLFLLGGSFFPSFFNGIMIWYGLFITTSIDYCHVGWWDFEWMYYVDAIPLRWKRDPVDQLIWIARTMLTTFQAKNFDWCSIVLSISRMSYSVLPVQYSIGSMSMNIISFRTKGGIRPKQPLPGCGDFSPGHTSW